MPTWLKPADDPSVPSTGRQNGGALPLCPESYDSIPNSRPSGQSPSGPASLNVLSLRRKRTKELASSRLRQEGGPGVAERRGDGQPPSWPNEPPRHLGFAPSAGSSHADWECGQAGVRLGRAGSLRSARWGKPAAMVRGHASRPVERPAWRGAEAAWVHRLEGPSSSPCGVFVQPRPTPGLQAHGRARAKTAHPDLRPSS